MDGIANRRVTETNDARDVAPGLVDEDVLVPQIAVPQGRLKVPEGCVAEERAPPLPRAQCPTCLGRWMTCQALSPSASAPPVGKVVTFEELAQRLRPRKRRSRPTPAGQLALFGF